MGSPRFILKFQTEGQVATAFKGDGIYYKGKIIILEPESKKWLEDWLKEQGLIIKIRPQSSILICVKLFSIINYAWPLG